MNCLLRYMGVAMVVAALLFFAGARSFAQSGNSEIFVFEISASNGKMIFSGGKNISDKPGYDNQPSFSGSGSSILFTSDRGGEDTDIYEFLIKSGATNRLTSTADNDYTPRSKSIEEITFVREGKGQLMSVWNLNLYSKEESTALVNKEPVAYYDWNAEGGALVWVRYASMAHYVNPSNSENVFVAEHVVPSSPQNIPGTLKFSFVHRQGNDVLWIKEFDPENKAIRPIVRPKGESTDYCWLPDGTIVTGVGTKLFGFNEKKDKDWIELADLSKFGLKDITRLAASPKGDRLAVVSNQ